MRKEIKRFIKICKMEQSKLKQYLVGRLKQYGYAPIVKDGFIYAKGSNILLTAHMDTVHEQIVKSVQIEKHPNETVISSPQGIGGDDRCGVYMILDLLTKGHRPTILFCEDEEIGGVGSSKFCETDYCEELTEMRYFIELDRANAKDAVYYDCGNYEFEEYITSVTGYTTNWGSFSDISNLSPATDVASVNLSCGYYKAHTLKEYVVFEEMENTIKVVGKLLNDKSDDMYDYQEYIPMRSKYGSMFYGYGNYNWDNYDYDMYCDTWYVIYKEPKKDKFCTEIVEGVRSEYEAIGKFLSTYRNLTANDIYETVDAMTYDEIYAC